MHIFAVSVFVPYVVRLFHLSDVYLCIFSVYTLEAIEWFVFSFIRSFFVAVHAQCTQRHTHTNTNTELTTRKHESRLREGFAIRKEN